MKHLCNAWVGSSLTNTARRGRNQFGVRGLVRAFGKRLVAVESARGVVCCARGVSQWRMKSAGKSDALQTLREISTVISSRAAFGARAFGRPHASLLRNVMKQRIKSQGSSVKNLCQRGR